MSNGQKDGLVAAIGLMSGTSMNGIDCTADNARTSLAVPAVLSHKVQRLGTPVTPKSIWRLNKASISDCVPPRLLYSGFSEATPSRPACFCTS